MTIISFGILALVGIIVTLISGLSEIFATVAGLVFAAVFLAYSIKWHKGRESMIYSLPIVLIIFALAIVIGQFVNILNVFTSITELTLSNIAYAFATVFFSEEIYDKLKKYFK